MNKRILFIYWASYDFSIIRNIVNMLEDADYIVIEKQLTHFQHTRIGKKLGVNSNNNILNGLYLLCNFIKLNIRTFFFNPIFVLGPNAIYTLFVAIVFQKKIICHYNELPNFIEEQQVKLKSRFDMFLFNRIKNIVVSNKYRLELLRKNETSKHQYFILDNVLEFKKVNQQLPDYSKQFLNTNKIRLMYTGVLNSNRMIEKLIRVIGGSDKYHLILAGFIDKKDLKLLKLIREYNNIEYKGVLSHSAIQQLISKECDFGIAFYTLDSLNNKFCAPLKIHEYFNCNKLMITLKNPPLVEIEDKYKLVYTLNFIDDLLSEEEFIKIEHRLKSIDLDDFKRYQLLGKEKFILEMNQIIKCIMS